jgi:Fe-S cluster assembly scaffold protein SufB
MANPMSEDIKLNEENKSLEQIGDYKYGFHDRDDNYVFKSQRGLNREVVENISRMKGEPQWMLEFRLKALEHFLARPMPSWGPDISNLDLDNIFYYVKPTEKSEKSWDDVPDDIKKTFDKLGIPEAERKFLAGVGAQYECLGGATRVYTARGVVPIRDVIPGDVVFSLDEATNQIIPAPVKNFMPKGERPVYEVKVGTRTIRATENHPFLALELHRKEGNQRGRYVRAWKYLRDLKKGDLVAVAKSLPDVGQDYELEQPKVELNWRHNHVELPKRTSKDLMWWLGLYMGDGFVHSENEKARVEVAIPATDQPLRNEFKQVTSRLFDIAAQNGDPYRLTVGSTIVARYLEANGFSGGALKKRVPDWVASLPQEQILSFIGGYVDADGYVRDHPKNKDVMLTSANPELLQDVRNLADVCGVGTSNIHRFEGKHPHDPDRTMVGYRMMFSGDFEKLGCRSEQRLVRMDKRKFHHSHSMAEGTSFRNHVNEYFGYARIESIVPAGMEMVYDIEVDGPHNFVAEGLIVHNSEMVYHSILEHLEKQGVIFLSIEDGLKQYPELFREYFGTVIPIEDNKFAALNSAVWSGGSFVYVPKGVKVDLPLQAYFRLNTANVGQFERTLIIVEEDASVHYVEGCTAPQYTTNSFHSGVIEIVVKKGARSRYSTIQNWSTNVFNLVTQRAKVFAGASHEWVDANLGCLAEGSTVTTPGGIKTIESLEVGDQVLSYDEAKGKLCFRAVTAKRFSGHQPIHTVSVGERCLQVTANHPFYSYHYNPDAAKKSGRYRFGYVRADELKEAILPRTSLDYGIPHFLTMPTLETKFDSMNQYAGNLTMTRQRPSHMTLGEYTTDDLMWMFGYWIGDGNMDVKPAKTEGVVRFARIGFSTPREDRAREKLMNVMTPVIDIEPSERPDGHYLAWNSKELVEFFKMNGFYGKASSKRVPEWIWSLPESQRLAFVAGYIDADGMVNAHGFHIRSANRQLLEDVASLLVTLGITSRLYTEFSEPRKVTIMGVECIAHGSYRLSFLPEERLLPYLSQQLQDKSLAQHTRQNKMRQTVGRSQLTLGEDVEIVLVEVSPVSQDPVPTWDIEVEGTGNFVSQGFIVHNSKLTMKYPSCYLMESGARGEMLSMAFAGPGQTQDAGGKMVHFAPNTTSKVTSKSISKGGGRASFRGLLKVHKGAKGVKSNTVCDALLLDPQSRSDTYPTIEIDEDDVTIGHEASVSKVGEEQLFYLMSRGLTEGEATSMVVSGFIEPLVKELPMEYAVEMNRLIQLQMEGSIG